MSFLAPMHRVLLNTLAGAVRLSVAQAKALLFGATLLSGALLWYTVTHVAINTDTAGMLDQSLPFRKAAHEFDAAFPHLSDQIVIVVEAAHSGDATSAAEQLAQQLREHPRVLQSVFHPGGGEFFDTHGLLYLDEEELWDLDERLTEAAPILGILARDPSLRGLFNALAAGLDEGDAAARRQLAKMFDRISGAVEAWLAGGGVPISWRDELLPKRDNKAGPVRAFLLTQPKLDFASFEPAAEALNLVHSLARDMEKSDPSLRIRVTGSAAMNSEELVTVSRDAVLTTTLAFVSVCLLLIWGLRSAGGVVAVLVSLLFGLIWTAAFATFAIGALNLISVCFAVLFIGMGVDFGIQYALRYHEECDQGMAQEPALRAAATGAGGALTLAAAGAAISFLSFVPTTYRGLAELGVISSFSMVVALVTSFTLLPAFLSLLPLPRKRITQPPRSDGGEFVRRYRAPILWVTLAASVLGVVLAPRTWFDFNPLNLKDPTTEAVATFRDLANDPETTPYTIQILTPDMERAEVMVAQLEQLSSVDKAVTLASYVPGDQDIKLEIIDAMRLTMTGVLPVTHVADQATTEEEAAALVEFSERLSAAEQDIIDPQVATSIARLRKALDRLQASPGWPAQAVPALRANLLGDMHDVLARLERALEAEAVSLETLPADLRERYVTPDGRARIEVFPKNDLNDNKALKEFVRGVQQIAPAATDSPVELLEASDAVIQSSIQAAALALILTVIMHIVVLKSVLDAILVAVPLVLAMLLTVTTSVIFKTPFNFANIIALPLLIGLNNAYGVYLVVRRHATPDLAQLLHSSTPRAVLLSGLATIASFGVLAVATHPGMGGMGILISLALGYALASSLIVLPAMMAALELKVKSE